MFSSDRFVKVDEETVINTEYIRWIKTSGKCFKVCNKMDGCTKKDTHIVCKTDNPEFYEELSKLFRRD